jgi:hypothetical protein
MQGRFLLKRGKRGTPEGTPGEGTFRGPVLGTFAACFAYLAKENTMKAQIANPSSSSWALVAVTVVLVAYPIARIVIPTVVHAVVPEVVRIVLNLI